FHAGELRRLLELDAERVRRELDAARVGILVAADEEIVVTAGRMAAEEVPLRADLPAEQERSGGFFVGALCRDRDPDTGISDDRFQELDRLLQIAALDPLFVGRLIGEPALVAHPDLIHFLVAAREQSI